MEYFLVYLWTRLDKILGVSIAFSIILIVTSIMLFIAFCFARDCKDEESAAKQLKYFKKALITAFISILISVSLPNRRDVIFIYLTPKAVHAAIDLKDSKGVQDSLDILNNLPALIKSRIKPYLEESEEQEQK